MQQLILSQVSGTEQPQEDVQLTELLPVKQSRIRENHVYKDADATDALKALRSFSGGCNDDQEFGLRIFDVEKTSVCESRREIKQSRGQLRRRRGVALDDEGANQEGKDLDARQIEGTTKREARDVDRKASVRSRSTKRLRESNGRAGVASATERRSSRGIEKRGHSESDEEFYLRYDDDANDNDDDDLEEEDEEQEEGEEEEEEEEEEEAPTYLDLDKSKDGLNDEIYVFRRELLDACSPSCELPEKFYGNDYSSTTDGTLFDRSSTRERGKDDNAIAESAVVEASSLISSKNELGSKIDEIILAKRKENNNVPREDDRNDPRVEASSSSSASSASSASTSPSRAAIEVEREKKSRSDDDTTSKNPSRRKEGSKTTGGGNASTSTEHQNAQKKYCCIVCNARFKGSGGLRNHYKVVHGAGPIFKCDECGKEFPLKERLKLHVRTHTGFKPYKCPECDKSFARGGQLVQHRRTHSQIKPYRCALCSGTFTCAANLALHVKRHNGQKDHKCEICGRGFVRRDALKKHLECLHRDVKSFLCVICNKTFKGHLPQHMRTHARDRPHGCATCGQRFAQKSQLTVHQRTHSGQRPFRCLVCWQAFAHSTALKLHTRRHTGERPFKCVECNAGFTQLPHWKKHMKCIHGRSEPYSCKICKSFFRIKSDLESHEKSCHRDNGETEVESFANPLVTGSDTTEKSASPSKYRVMTVERMRLLLAVLLKRISKQEKLDELGFGKRLIDEVLQDSLISAGKDPATGEGLTELETLTKNLETFLEWTVPKEHWENFRRMKKTPEDILETLTAT